MECVACKSELEFTNKRFTGVDNQGYGKEIYFFYCLNEKCLRYKLFCDFSVKTS